MSHKTVVKSLMKDLDALEATLDEQFPSLELRRGQLTHRMYGRPQPCQHAIGIRGDTVSYEIGLVRTGGNEHYDLAYDSYDGRLEPICGAQLGRLRQEYAVTVATRKAMEKLARHGVRIQREAAGPNVRLRLRLR